MSATAILICVFTPFRDSGHCRYGVKSRRVTQNDLKTPSMRRNRSVPIDIIGSIGGDLEAGLQIGRIIHAHKMAIYIGPCCATALPCVSACNFIFMGGVVRQINVGGQFKVHMFDATRFPTLMLTDIDEAAQAANPSQKKPGQPEKRGQPLVAAQALVLNDTIGSPIKIAQSTNLPKMGCNLNTMRY